DECTSLRPTGWMTRWGHCPPDLSQQARSGSRIRRHPRLLPLGMGTDRLLAPHHPTQCRHPPAIRAVAGSHLSYLGALADLMAERTELPKSRAPSIIRVTRAVLV